MKRSVRRLLPFLLLLASLFSTSILASKSTNVTASPGQDCPTTCAQKRDTTLESCNTLEGERKTRCQNSANAQYDKCIEACNNGNSGRGSGGSGKNP